MESAFLWAVGPRVEEPGLSLIPGHAYSAPYEDLKLKNKGGEHAGEVHVHRRRALEAEHRAG